MSDWPIVIGNNRVESAVVVWWAIFQLVSVIKL